MLVNESLVMAAIVLTCIHLVSYTSLLLGYIPLCIQL